MKEANDLHRPEEESWSHQVAEQAPWIARPLPSLAKGHGGLQVELNAQCFAEEAKIHLRQLAPQKQLKYATYSFEQSRQ